MMNDGLIENKEKNYYITKEGKDALKSFVELTFEGERLINK